MHVCFCVLFPFLWPSSLPFKYHWPKEGTSERCPPEAVWRSRGRPSPIRQPGEGARGRPFRTGRAAQRVKRDLNRAEQKAIMSNGGETRRIEMHMFPPLDTQVSLPRHCEWSGQPWLYFQTLLGCKGNAQILQECPYPHTV